MSENYLRDKRLERMLKANDDFLSGDFVDCDESLRKSELRIYESFDTSYDGEENEGDFLGYMGHSRPEDGRSCIREKQR